jgi:hypothetical protein
MLQSVSTGDNFFSDPSSAVYNATEYFQNGGTLKKMIGSFQHRFDSVIKYSYEEGALVALECFRIAIESKKNGKNYSKARNLFNEKIKVLASEDNLINCCYNGFIEIAKKFRQLGISVDCFEDGNGFTPLHYAVSKNNKELTKWLIAENALVDNAPNNVWTPLNYACLEQFNNQIYQLLDAGANPNLRTVEKVSSLDIACGKNNFPMALLLMRYGADPTSLDQKYQKTIDLFKARIPKIPQGIHLPNLPKDLEWTLLNLFNSNLNIVELFQASSVCQQWRGSILALLGRKLT